MDGAKVIPLLLNLEFSDISGPLAQFQAKKVERIGVFEIVQSINKSADQPVPEDRAKQLFNALWPSLEEQFDALPDEAPTEKNMRPQHEILEELVTGVRGLESRFRDVESVVAERGVRSPRRFKRIHPMMFEEIAHMVSDESDDPVSLLMFGGLLRDDFPWLYEIIMEVYREIRSGDTKAARKAVERLHRLTRVIGRGPFLDEMIGPSKEAHMIARELPMMLDHMIHSLESRRLKSPSEAIEVEPPEPRV